MDSCVRGFSFMPDSKTDLQFIEGGELERAWRSTRRERMKQREQKIWDDFVKEQDAVKGVCKDDPYQFLDPLPESCMKEILEKPQPKVKIEEEPKVQLQAQHGTGDSTTGDDGLHTCVVTFADEMEKDDSDMFYIFDDDQSGGEDDNQNEPNSPDTVRERSPEPAGATATAGAAEPASNQSPERDNELKESSSKSSENVASVVESSIYCARVKELRGKINEELKALMTSLDRHDILVTSEAEDIARMVKRSAEFCNRFNRIHMYQLQRQIHDIKRNSSQSLPFAKHTQFQSQMIRIVTLHQNLLQSFMVFHKSFSQTCCVRESVGALGSLLAAVRDSTHMCLNVPPPKDFAACLDLYKDDLLTTCDQVDEFVNEYAIRCEEFLNRFETMTTVSSKKSKKEIKVKKSPWNKKNPMKSGTTESQLSMYSMDTRLTFHAKSSTSSKAYQTASTSKVRLGAGTNLNQKRGIAEKNSEILKNTKMSRRPLMRDPHAGRPRALHVPATETDIQTMVQAYGTCASNHEDSPRTHTNKRCPPRLAPHASRAAGGGGGGGGKRTAQASPLMSSVQSTPRVSTPRSMNQPAKEFELSPRYTRPSNESSKPKPPGLSPKSTKALQDSQSLIKNEQEAEECPVIPVLTIKCATKKDLKSEEAEAKKSSSRREDTNEMKKGSTDASQLKLVYKYEDGSQTEASPKRSRTPSGRAELPPLKHESHELERNQLDNSSPDCNEATRLFKQLHSGDGSVSERVTGTKNAQLMYVNGNSPRQSSTPQLLRAPASARCADHYRLQFNIGERTADALFQYRTKFVQHMLTSAMYANSAVGKPWEMIGNVSEQIIDEVLLNCLSKMELRGMINELYKKETGCP